MWWSEESDEVEGDEAPASIFSLESGPLDFSEEPNPRDSMLDADFCRLPTDACVDILRRDLSSAFRSICIMEDRMGGRFVEAAMGSPVVDEEFMDWVRSLYAELEDVFGDVI